MAKDFRMKLNPILRVIPIVYDDLPDKPKFLTSCETVVAAMNDNDVFQYYGFTALLAEGLIRFCPYLTEGVIPPRNLRYNRRDGWMGVGSQIRSRLDLLKTPNPVRQNSDVRYPNVDKGDLILAIIPSSIETTSQVWAEESHFGPSYGFVGDPLKALTIPYHVRITDEKGAVKEEFFKAYDEQQIAYHLIEQIAEYHMGITDVQMETVRIRFGYETKDTKKENELFNRLRVLYYGNDICSKTGLKRALLLFDDIHFHDRPSYKIGGLGSIGRGSRMRQYSYSFAEAGIPILIHKGLSDLMSTAMEDAVAGELEDPRFSRIFLEGLKTDEDFRSLFIRPHADYGPAKGDEVFRAMMKLDLGGRPYDLNVYRKCTVKPFDPNSQRSLEETFANFLIDASMKLNLCCVLSHENDIIPFTEYPTLEKLMALRHKRIIEKGERPAAAPRAILYHLSTKIFDYVIPTDALERSSLKNVIRFRQETRREYSNFRKYLMKLNSQIEAKVWDEPLQKEIEGILHQEVVPAVDRFQNECKRIWEKMFGGIVKRTIEVVSAAASTGFVISYFAGVSWVDVLAKGCGVMAPIVLPPVIDYALEKRNLKRQNSIAYLMHLKRSIG